MPLQRAAVGEHRQMAGCIVEAGELQPGVGWCALRGLAAKRFAVAGLETGPHGRPPAGILHRYEPPGLAEANRRGQRRRVHQTLQRARGQGRGLEGAHIPPPDQEIPQSGPEGRIEVGWLRHVTPPWGHPSLGVSFFSQRLAWARTRVGAVPP